MCVCDVAGSGAGGASDGGAGGCWGRPRRTDPKQSSSPRLAAPPHPGKVGGARCSSAAPSPASCSYRRKK